MLARGDQVLVMEVGRFQGVQQGQQSSLPLIKALDFANVGTAPGLDKLDPAVVAAVEDFQKPEGRMVAAVVDPGKHLLKMLIARERPGLVDDLQPRLEACDDHCPASAMGVAGVAADV